MAFNGRCVVMGVSGAGKTVVGRLLAERLGAAFIEGDDLHPAANRSKMAGGEALTDEDRWPWLDAVGRALAEAPSPAVGACSALRRAYRDRLRLEVPGLVIVALDQPRAVLEGRLRARKGHFMPPALLQSQLDTLEPLGRDEAGVVVDNAGPPEATAARAADALARL
jgi:gluconokinase